MTKVVLLWISEFYFLNRKISGMGHGTVLPTTTLANISKELDREGIENTVIDSDILYLTKYDGLEPDEFKKKLFYEIEKLNPEIIGIGCWGAFTPLSIEMCRELKERNPNLKIIMGGTAATFSAEKLLKLAPWIDFVVRGEGLKTITEIIRSLEGKKPINQIKGLSYQNNGKISHNLNRPLLKSFDEYPLIDFENFLGIDKYRKFDIMTYFFSLGCSYGCAFCVNTQLYPQVRFHSIDKFMKQIKHLHDLYTFNSIEFTDDIFFSNVPIYAKLLEKLHKTYPKLKYLAQMRMEKVSREIIQTATKNNMIELDVSIESMNENALNFLGRTRKITEYKSLIYRNLRKIENSNLKRSHVASIIGAPVETKQDMDKTLNFVENINKTSKILKARVPQSLMVYPGSKIWSLWEQKKIDIIENERVEKILTPFQNKYKHYNWLVPEYYLIKNNHLNNDKFKNYLFTKIKEFNDQHYG